MNKLISIIIPVYNVECYLGACMESVLNQTYKKIEVILVDDGATDNSGQMCDHYAEEDMRVRVIHKKNGGLADARNKGITHANGDYIMFIDSDDVVSQNFVEYLYSLIIENSSDIGICNPIHCYPGRKIKFEPENMKKIFKPEDAIVEMLYQKSFLVAAWGKIFKKEYFDDILFPYGMLFEDSAIMYKIFDKAEKIVYSDAKLYGYMHWNGSITTNDFSKRDCDILTICSQITDYMENKNERLWKAAMSYQTAAAFRIYMNAPRNGEFDLELRDCKMFLKENWKLVLQDPNIRYKMKIALLMFKYARPIMPIIYKKTNRWK